jgi:hypothetical protein
VVAMQVLVSLTFDLKMSVVTLHVFPASEHNCPTNEVMLELVLLTPNEAQFPPSNFPQVTLGHVGSEGVGGARTFGYKTFLTQSGASTSVCANLALTSLVYKTEKAFLSSLF